ncbi:MAG TPA: 5-methyltetrahydropteroyltriglutamate--homocysteine S-methyltransferase [Alphaproteobacteria bacterium]|nr:5-methyltetrahydropteroyltriglutamate--homocysteine S-methyltransferase [Alphaproteobacteria bacterium]
MTARTTPPFRADQVGSLLRPPQLLAARAAREKDQIPADEFQRIEDQAVRDVVKMQEGLGFKAVTDGEYRRGSWHRDFLVSFENVKIVQPTVKMKFHTEKGDIERTPPGLKVVGKLKRTQPIFVDHFKFLKSVAHSVPKLTIPSPSNMHFRGGREAIDQKAYPDMPEFYADLARVFGEEVRDLSAAGCKYLQIDEVNFAYLCDPTLREEVKALGEDPQTLPHTYARLINETVAPKAPDMTICMHLCRGNARSAWIAEGGYEPVAEVLFNEINVTGYFLEFDSPRAGGFEPLRFVPKGKVVVLGLVTTKKGQLESKDELKRRIEQAAKHVPIEQLALSPQCGFSSTVEGNLITVDEEIKKLELVVETAREVWGSA